MGRRPKCQGIVPINVRRVAILPRGFEVSRSVVLRGRGVVPVPIEGEESDTTSQPYYETVLPIGTTRNS